MALSRRRCPLFAVLVSFPLVVNVALVRVCKPFWNARSSNDAHVIGSPHVNQNPMSFLSPWNVRDTQPSGGAGGEDSVPFVGAAASVEARLSELLGEVAPSEDVLRGVS